MRIARVLPLVFAAAALPIAPAPCAEEPASPRPDPQALPDLLKEEYRALEAHVKGVNDRQSTVTTSSSAGSPRRDPCARGGILANAAAGLRLAA